MFNREWRGICFRCGKASVSSILSMFNEDLICVSCKEQERSAPGYRQAEVTDLRSYAGRLQALGMDHSAQNVNKLATELESEES